MAKRSDNFLKRTIIDIAGILLVVLAVLVGWLPGPLGIPLLLAGLGLLSINHEWAQRWLNRAKQEGGQIVNKIFTDKPIVRWGWDCTVIVLVALAAYILRYRRERVLISLAIALLCMSLFLFLANRDRYSRVKRFAKAKR